MLEKLHSFLQNPIFSPPFQLNRGIGSIPKHWLNFLTKKRAAQEYPKFLIYKAKKYSVKIRNIFQNIISLPPFQLLI